MMARLTRARQGTPSLRSFPAKGRRASADAPAKELSAVSFVRVFKPTDMLPRNAPAPQAGRGRFRACAFAGMVLAMRPLSFTLCIIAITVATATAQAEPETDGSDRAMPAETRASLLGRLDDALYDGRSARLKDIRLAKDGRYCGRLNAKNQAGGYTGWSLFSFNAETRRLGFENAGPYSLDAGACGITKHL